MEPGLLSLREEGAGAWPPGTEAGGGLSEPGRASEVSAREWKAGSPSPSSAVGRRPAPDPGPPERVQLGAGGRANISAVSEQEEELPPRQG